MENRKIYRYATDFIGLSTNEKPTSIDAEVGSGYIEIDTGNIFMFNGEEWFPI